MRVGYLRFTQNCDIDWINGSAGTKAVELRLGILEGLVDLGHTPVILSKVPKDQLHLLKGPEEDQFGYEYGFMKAVEYCPNDVPEMDLVIVEGSTDNINFGYSGVQRFADIFKQYDGRAVAYHHGDQVTSVPIGEIYRAGLIGPDEDPKRVLYRNAFQGVPWREAQWELWTPGKPDKLAGLASMRRGYWRIPAERRKRFRLGYSPTFDVPRQAEMWGSRAALIYVGAQRNPYRMKKICQYYLPDCKLCEKQEYAKLLYGFWEKIYRGFDYRGFVPGFGLVYYLLPQAYATIAVTDDWFCNQEMITTRMIQGPRAGLFTMYDSAMNPEAGNYLPAACSIRNHAEVHERLNWFLNLSAMDEKDFLDYQRSFQHTWAERLLEVL